jgi:polyhydroxybutyrate depolymerase
MQPGEELETEIRFFSDLINQLSSNFNIDPARIYVNGYSNGAAMTIMLACSLPDRIAAFGMVATPIVPWEWCQDSNPAPVIVFNGTEDPFVPYEGGENFLTTEPLLSMPEWIALWGERNLCNANPADIEIDQTVTLRQYTGCARGTAAELYTLEGAGHIWPGGLKFPNNFAGAYSDSIDASKTMWLFFLDHPLPHDPQ